MHLVNGLSGLLVAPAELLLLFTWQNFTKRLTVE